MGAEWSSWRQAENFTALNDCLFVCFFPQRLLRLIPSGLPQISSRSKTSWPSTAPHMALTIHLFFPKGDLVELKMVRIPRLPRGWREEAVLSVYSNLPYRHAHFLSGLWHWKSWAALLETSLIFLLSNSSGNPNLGSANSSIPSICPWKATELKFGICWRHCFPEDTNKNDPAWEID